MGIGESGDGGGGGDNMYKGSAESVLVSLSNLYSDDNKISVSNSRYSSCPAYTDTDYCSKKTILL